MEESKKYYRDRVTPLPEDIYTKGIRPTLESVQKAIPRENVAGAIAELRGHSEPALAQLESKENNAEIFALAGHFSEHVWERLGVWVKEHPQELGSAYMDDKLHVEKFDTVPHRIIREQFERDPRDGFNKLSGFTGDTLRRINTEYFDELSELAKGVEPLVSRDQLFEKKAFQRYNNLLTDSQRHRHSFQGSPPNHVVAGLQTANGISWQLIASLPRTFEQTFARQPTPEEFNELLGSARGFVLYLATLELSVFAATAVDLFPKKQHDSDYLPYVKGLEITRTEKGKLQLDIDAKVLKLLAKEVLLRLRAKDWDEKSTRLGCPAIAARGQSGRNLVVEIFDWSAELTKKFYLPTIKK